MSEDYTEDLSKFGYRELDEAGKLLSAIKSGLPEDLIVDNCISFSLLINSKSRFSIFKAMGLLAAICIHKFLPNWSDSWLELSISAFKITAILPMWFLYGLCI